MSSRSARTSATISLRCYGASVSRRSSSGLVAAPCEELSTDHQLMGTRTLARLGSGAYFEGFRCGACRGGPPQDYCPANGDRSPESTSKCEGNASGCHLSGTDIALVSNQ